MEITWNNKPKSRGRKPSAIIINADGAVSEFRESGVIGQYHVSETEYEKAGKWSNSTYRITLGSGVRFYSWVPDFGTGKSFPEANTWEDVYREIFQNVGLPIERESLVACMRAMRPKFAARIDESESILLSLGKEPELVKISFGSPTNRQIDAGFWTRSEVTQDGVTIQKDCEYWNYATLATVRVVDPPNARVLRVETERGYHGGYVTVTVALDNKEI